MAKRVTASMRTRESLSDLIEAPLSSADGRAELMKLATRLNVEEALEAESRDALGRNYFEHGASPGPELAQRRAHGPSEDGGGAGGLCGAADRRSR